MGDDRIKTMLALPSSGAGNRRAIRMTDLVGRDWIAQEKVDGIRAVLYSQDGACRIFNRSGTEITERFPEIASLRLPDAVLDGEIVAKDGLFSTAGTRDKQTKGFQAAAKKHPCRFTAFDLLEAGGQRLTGLPLQTRLQLLRGVLGRRRMITMVRTSEDILGLWQEVVASQGEGIVVKKRKSIYLPGERASSWIKFKAVQRLTAIAVGYEPGNNRALGAIRLALLDGARPVDIGRVGTGWTLRQEGELQRRLDAGEIFTVEVEALNRTSENMLRFPVFRGERTDLELEAASALQLNGLPVY